MPGERQVSFFISAIRNQWLSELQPKHQMFITRCNYGDRVHFIFLRSKDEICPISHLKGGN